MILSMKPRFIALFFLIKKEPKKSRLNKNLLKIIEAICAGTNSSAEADSGRRSRFLMLREFFETQIFNGRFVTPKLFSPLPRGS